MNTPAVPARPRRIALIHALRDSIEPILAAFARHWPQAETFNVLDDSLSAAVAAHGRLSAPIIERFLALGRHAAASDIENGSASWLKVRSPSARLRSLLRRVASPSAWKTISRWGHLIQP